MLLKSAFRLFILLSLWFMPVCAIQGRADVESSPDDDDAWLEDDWEARVRAINEGELEFLGKPPDGTVLNTTNTLTVTADSIRTGWVELYQCQAGLDPLPSVEIVYRYSGIRNLRVVRSQGIGSVQVAGHTVQLTDVTGGAEVCMQAEVRVLNKVMEGRYEIQSGPFHRRFLDGYFPLHLQYKLNYPASMLELESVIPRAQNGFDARTTFGKLEIDTWFEGRLSITVRFRSASSE